MTHENLSIHCTVYYLLWTQSIIAVSLTDKYCPQSLTVVTLTRQQKVWSPSFVIQNVVMLTGWRNTRAVFDLWNKFISNPDPFSLHISYWHHPQGFFFLKSLNKSVFAWLLQQLIEWGTAMKRHFGKCWDETGHNDATNLWKWQFW